MFEINDEIYTFTHSMIYKLIDAKFVEISGLPLPLNPLLKYYDYLSESVIYLSNDGVIKLNSDGDFKILVPFEFLPDYYTIANFHLFNNNTLYVGTTNNGVFIYDKFYDLNFSYSKLLNSRNITDCHIDSSGNIWISTLYSGVYVIPSSLYQNKILFQNNYSNNISCFEIDNDGTIWIGTDNGIVYKKKSDSIIEIDLNSIDVEITYNKVIDILVIDNLVLILTKSGIIYLNKEDVTNIYPIIMDPIYSYFPLEIVKDSQGSVTMSNINGVFKLTLIESQYVLERHPLVEPTRTYSHCISEDQSIWFATSESINKINDEDSEQYFFSEIGVNQRPKEIKLLNDSIIAVNTNGDGVSIISNGLLKDRLTVSSGLSSNSVLKMQVIDSTLWLLTSDGIDKVDFNNSFDSIVNLNCKNCNLIDFFVNENNIFFSSKDYINRIDQFQILNKPEPLKAYITNLDFNYNSEPFNFNIGDLVRFNIDVINFDFNHEALYEYQLAGYHDDWVSTKMKYFEFPALEPGSYTFRFRTRTKNSDWSIPLESSFYERSPFLKQLIFYLPLFLLVLFFIYRNIKRKQFNKLKQNFKIKSLEQKALQTSMNPHFTFNVLNSIQFYLTSNDTKNAQINLSRFAKLIRMNLEINQDQLISISEEVTYLKLYLSLEELRFDDSFKYTINVDPLIDQDNTYIPPILIQPFVENSIWHGIMPQAGVGELFIEFSLRESFLMIVVFDNGVGFKNSNKNEFKSKHKSMGLKMLKERLTMLSNVYDNSFSMQIENLENNDNHKSGTKVILKFPLNLF